MFKKFFFLFIFLFFLILNLICAKCKIELFIFSGFILNSNDTPDIFCLNCLEKINSSKSKEIIIQYNYSEEELKQFIDKLNLNPKFFNLSNAKKPEKVIFSLN